MQQPIAVLFQIALVIMHADVLTMAVPLQTWKFYRRRVWGDMVVVPLRS